MPEYPLSMLRPSPRTLCSVGKDDGLDLGTPTPEKLGGLGYRSPAEETTS